MSISEIELLAKEHAADRALLAERVTALQEEIQAAKNRRLTGIKSALGRAKDSRVRLEALIDESRAEFAKPRTRILHGIRVGLRKGAGKLKYAVSAEKVIELIRRHFADQAETLIRTKETPINAALAALPAADLKRIGCSIEATGDYVVIEPADSDIDKLVAALLDEQSDELEDEA